MDYPQSEAWEGRVQRQIMSVFGPLQSARTVDEIDRRLANLEPDMAAALDEAFDQVYSQAIIFVLLFMMNDDPGYQPLLDEFRRDPRLASDLGTQQARRVAAEVADSTRRRVVEFRGRPRPVSPADGAAPVTPTPEFNDFRDNLFGTNRAEAIAITETTDAISRAETEAAGIISNSTSPHYLHGVWQTSEDEKVCPICEPLHDQPMEVYSRMFQNGPPAHPRCRCRIRWAVRQLHESTVRPMRLARRMLLNEAVHMLLEFDTSKHPRGPDGKFIGKLSGVDFGKWNMGHPSAKGAVKKIGELEAAGRAGDWDKFEKLMYKPKGGDAAKPNSYQKLVLKAQATILSKKGELDAKVAARKAKTPAPGKDALDAEVAKGKDLMAKADALLAKAGEAKGGALATGADHPAAATTAEMPKAIGKWEKVGGKLGTEVGGVYVSPDGVKHYVKTPDNPARAHNEDLAIQLYKATGAGVVDGGIVDAGDGKVSVATKWIDSAKTDWSDPAVRKKAGEDFAVHAWLNNWDAVGSGSENPMDNIRMAGGKLTLVDAGGSLDYSGMGGSGKKPLSADAPEWENLRNPAKAGTMSQVFGSMSDDELKASAMKLKGMTDEKVKALVDAHHGGTAAEKAAMSDVLIKRRDAILKKAGVGAIGEESPKPKPVVTPEELVKAKAAVKPISDGDVPFGTAEPSKIPPPPVVTSAANAGAQKKFDAIAAAAATGDIAAVEAIATNSEAKQTYAKKHHQYKMAVLAAMKGGAAPDESFKAKAVPAAPAPAAPAPKAPAVPQISGIDIAKATLPPVTASSVSSPSAYAVQVQLHQWAANGEIDKVKAFKATGPLTGGYKDKLIAHFDKAELAAAKVNAGEGPDLTPGKAALDAEIAKGKDLMAKAGSLLAKAGEAKGDPIKVTVPPPPPLTLPKSKEDAKIIHELGKKGDLATLKKMDFSSGSPTVKAYHQKVMASLTSAAPGSSIPPMPDVSTPHVVGEMVQLQALAKAGNVAGIKGFKYAGTKAGPTAKYQQALLAHLKNNKPAPLALPTPPLADMDSFETEQAKGWMKKAAAGDLQGLLAGDPLGGIEGKAAKQYHAALVDMLKPPKSGATGSAAAVHGPHGPMPEPINPLSGQQKAIANAAANGKYLPMLAVLSPDNSVNPKDREYARQLYQWVTKKHGGEGPEIPQLGKKVKAPTPTVAGSYAKLAEAAVKPGAATKVHDWNVTGHVGGVPEIPDGQWAHAEDVTDISDRGSAAYNKLPKHYQEVLHEYTGSEYGLINSQLRTLPPDKWGKSTRDAYDALHKGSIPLKKGLMLSRKFGSWDRTKGLEPGMVIHEGAVLSTSLTEAAWQGKVHMKITVGEGVKGIPAKHFSANDTHEGDSIDPTNENEVLLPPGTRFVVTKRKEFGSHVELHVVALPN